MPTGTRKKTTARKQTTARKKPTSRKRKTAGKKSSVRKLRIKLMKIGNVIVIFLQKKWI